jgi:hypothetical protein
MKLIDAINNVDRTVTKANDHWVDREELGNALGLQQTWGEFPDDFDTRIKTYWLSSWYCTDSWVGLRAIYFDDKPVGCVYQGGRKSDMVFEFLSEGLALDLRDYLASEIKPTFPLVNMDEEVDEYYTVSYGSQLLVTKGFYNGEPVDLVKVFNGYGAGESADWRFVEVRIGSGVVKKIPVAEFKIPLNVKGYA